MTSKADQKSLILALDYGGTKHSAGAVAAGAKEWLARESVSSKAGADRSWDQAAMIKLARKLLARLEGRLVAVGTSFGGMVEARTGTVVLSHHVPGWENVPLREQLMAEFIVPAAVANDAQAAALGEYKFGAGRDSSSLLYLTVSTGIGGGWVLNGEIHPGADGLAGQIGHTVVRPGGTLCVCGKRGCLEAEACGPALARKMTERSGPGASPPWTGEAVARAAQQGDPLAQAVIAEAAAMLGTGLGTAINLMNPELVLLGGGVTKSGPRWWQIVRDTARAHALPQLRVNLQPAALADDAPLWGAVALAEMLLAQPVEGVRS